MNGTMKAVIFERPGQYAVVDKPIPKIRQSNEMLIRIDACSICGTDMQILKNPPGIAAAPGVTIGHEMVGTVVEVGDGVKNFKAGDRVTADNNVPARRAMATCARICFAWESTGMDFLPNMQSSPISWR